ncbi:hypothetical protein OHW97_02005 [Acinetobacter baumannii]|nr:hypothetical protein [Acinetobacter baumannii]
MTDLNKEREALVAQIEEFKKDAMELWFVPDLAESYKNMDMFSYSIVENNEVFFMREQARQLWSFWNKAKAQAVPEGRTDIEIIKQTIGLVDLIAKANRFERNKSAALPFESQNPRVKEWWDLACEIQDLLTQTDPNNCDFEEYKDLVASESGAEG